VGAEEARITREAQGNVPRLQDLPNASIAAIPKIVTTLRPQ
jgi:hypothetical protein